MISLILFKLYWSLSEWLRCRRLLHILYITISIYVVWKWQANILNEIYTCWKHILTHPNDVFFMVLLFMIVIFFWQISFLFSDSNVENIFTLLCFSNLFFLLSSRQQKQNRTAFCFRAYVVYSMALHLTHRTFSSSQGKNHKNPGLKGPGCNILWQQMVKKASCKQC